MPVYRTAEFVAVHRVLACVVRRRCREAERCSVSRPRGSRDRHGKAKRVDASTVRFVTRAFGECIRRAREDADVSASELAAAIGVYEDCVNRWESGRRTPRLSNLTAIAMALRVPFDHLVPEV